MSYHAEIQKHFEKRTFGPGPKCPGPNCPGPKCPGLNVPGPNCPTPPENRHLEKKCTLAENGLKLATAKK